MYLSQLKIFGFKSFANKTQLKFNNGITCIIGPNGSGKSNIVDAVRWVLGEQRTTALRSDKMENVIFNGTKERKPMGMAEVSMTIQNTKNILKTEFGEVVIARRLYRSGESQYLINNTPVRLKDVLDIFMDSGLGANSYSVIELKMVESILSENRTERRLLLEEAAGVVKYKIRRKSALRKLDATRSDLLRVNDIISEVAKTVQSLSRQVGKARRYLSYSEELKKWDVELARVRYHRLLDELRPLQAQLEEVSKLKDESHHQITIDEALLEDYKRELVEKEKELQHFGHRLQELDNRIAQIKQDQAVAETKSAEMAKVRERSLGEIETFEKKILLINEQLSSYASELETLNIQKVQLDEEFAQIESERKNELETLLKEKNEIDRLNDIFRKQLTRLSDKKEHLKQKIYALKFQKKQFTELQGKITQADIFIKNLKETLSKLKRNEEALRQTLQNLEEKIIEIRTQNETLGQKAAQLAHDKNKQQAELEKVKSRRQFFEQLIDRYEGHSESTQFVMASKMPGVHGPLAELLSVNEHYTAALETVLGAALDYVIVDSVSAAKNIIEQVRVQKKGRITLIPLDRLQEIPKPKSDHLPISASRLIDQIKCDQRFRNIIDLLLGDVLLASSINEALELSKAHPYHRFVTAQGEMVTFNRSITGGSARQSRASILGRKEQLKKLSEQENHLLKKIEAITGKEQALIKQRTDIDDRLDDFLNQNERIHSQLIENDKARHQKQFEIRQFEKDAQNAEAELNALRQTIWQLEQEIARLNTEAESEQNDLNKLEKQTIQRTKAYEEKNDAMQAILEDVQQARLKVSNLQNQIANRQADINRANASVREWRENIQRRKQEIEEIDRNLIQIKAHSEKRKQEQLSLWEARDQLDTEKEKFEQNFLQLKERIAEIEDQTRQYRHQHDSSLEKSRGLELKINEHRYKAESIREYALKEYAQDVEIGIPFEDFNEEQAEEKIELLRSRIKNLGPVNPLAVSEYDKEKERLDFLTKQRDDLLKAEESLMETIDKINKTARAQFLETFTAIKQNFEKVFQNFFENGEGSIALEEQRDPLEADIEINVRTKGKKLQTLSLLSGGEKTLTAISLLFAIYLVKPSPFCIFDEVDAPLDDVNITRFNQALINFSDHTQFIVVTHNKQTMEAASSLYGVTMEEEGVSKLVSVQFT